MDIILFQNIFWELPRQTIPSAYLKRKFGFTSSDHLPINTQNGEEALLPNSQNISTQCKMAPRSSERPNRESITSGDGGVTTSFDTKRKDVLGSNHKMHFITTVNSRSKA